MTADFPEAQQHGGGKGSCTQAKEMAPCTASAMSPLGWLEVDFSSRLLWILLPPNGPKADVPAWITIRDFVLFLDLLEKTFSLLLASYQWSQITSISVLTFKPVFRSDFCLQKNKLPLSIRKGLSHGILVCNLDIQPNIKYNLGKSVFPFGNLFCPNTILAQFRILKASDWDISSFTFYFTSK